VKSASVNVEGVSSGPPNNSKFPSEMVKDRSHYMGNTEMVGPLTLRVVPQKQENGRMVVFW
jgi:hypothetical protein